MARLKKGEKAIEFSANDYLDNNIDLNDYKGKKILLSFFRGASCVFCNIRVNQLITKYPDFKKKGIEIIAIFISSKDEISKYAGKQKAPFIVIPNPSLDLYEKYGVEESYSGLFKALITPSRIINALTSRFFSLHSLKDKPVIPADFLIDENQDIYKAYYGKDFGDHLPIDEILSWE